MELGFNEIMIFNETLCLQIRSETLKKRIADGKNPEKMVVKQAMLFKIRDEQLTNKEAEKEVREERKRLKTEYGENTRKTKGILKMLNTEAQKKRAEKREKYRLKIQTLKKNHKLDEEEKISRVPLELVDYTAAKVFSREEFDEIEEPEISIVTVGDITMTEEENMILKKNPKFALLENLKLEDLELDFELSYGKYRYQLHRELREKRDKEREKEKTGIGDMEDEETPEEKQRQETEEAECRQVFNPLDKTYDARKLRVTDMQINTRVTLPKGLPSHHEAWVEVRRAKYEQVCTKYIK